MSKLIDFSSVTEQANPSEKEIIKKVISDIPQKPNSGGTVATPQQHVRNSKENQGSFALGWLPYSTRPQNRQEAIRTLSIIGLKVIVNHITGILVDMNLSKYTINTLKKHKKNEKLFNFINNEVKDVFKANPGYRPCSAKQFEKTNMWQFLLSEWRNKSGKDKAHYVARHSFDNLVSIVLADIIPIPGAATIISPILKSALQYIGADLLLRPLYNIVVEIDGNTLSFGLTYKPVGFAFTDITLYTFNKEGKLVASHLKNPPESLYRITEKDARGILNKMGWDASLDRLKSEVKGNGK